MNTAVKNNLALLASVVALFGAPALRSQAVYFIDFSGPLRDLSAAAGNALSDRAVPSIAE